MTFRHFFVEGFSLPPLPGQTGRVGEAFGCPGDRSVGSGLSKICSNNKQLKELRLMEEIRLTSWYGKYPIIYRVLYIPGGAELLPSTVSPVSHAYLRWSVDSRWWITWFKHLLQLLRGRFHLSVSFDTLVFKQLAEFECPLFGLQCMTS